MPHESEERIAQAKVTLAGSSGGLIFSSLNPQFSLVIFLEQLKLQIFFPLSLPYFLYVYGTVIIVGHGFNMSPLAVVTWGHPILLTTMIVSTCLVRSILVTAYINRFNLFYYLNRHGIILEYSLLSQLLLFYCIGLWWLSNMQL